MFGNFPRDIPDLPPVPARDALAVLNAQRRMAAAAALDAIDKGVAVDAPAYLPWRHFAGGHLVSSHNADYIATLERAILDQRLVIQQMERSIAEQAAQIAALTAQTPAPAPAPAPANPLHRALRVTGPQRIGLTATTTRPQKY